MTPSPPWKVGKTQRTMSGVGGRHGFSFSIQDGRGAPIVTISYATEEQSKEAEAVVRKAIENAVNISKP